MKGAEEEDEDEIIAIMVLGRVRMLWQKVLREAGKDDDDHHHHLCCY